MINNKTTWRWPVFIKPKELFVPALACSLMFGCVKRKIDITSNPSGALVWVNNMEVGKTPVEIDFLYYGEYDIRVEEDGSEPVMTTRSPQRPLWDLPVLDFVAEVSPFTLKSNSTWHFELEPRNDSVGLLVERAKQARLAANSDE